LSTQAQERWIPVAGLKAMAGEPAQKFDAETDQHTKLTRFFLAQIQWLLAPKRNLTRKKYSSSVDISMKGVKKGRPLR